MEIADIEILPHPPSWALFGTDGPRYWVNDVECDRVTYERATWWPGNPIFKATIEALGVCSNCLTNDCGCCRGCGALDADLDSRGHHPYPGGCC